MSQTQVVSVKLTQDEKELLEKLANYLYKLGKIPSPTTSDAIRLCLHFTVREIIKSIEVERYGT